MTQQDKLRQFAKDQGMTQAQLAARLGIRRESVSRVLSGNDTISTDFVGRFFRTFGPEAAARVFVEPAPDEAVA